MKSPPPCATASLRASWGRAAFLDEVQLAEEMKISRTPLREALKVLTAEGLVRHEPRRGCFVNEVTEQDLDEIFPVIALLEGRCAFEAARNATDADLAALEEPCTTGSTSTPKPGASTTITTPTSPSTRPSSRWPTTAGWPGVITDLRKIVKLARLQQLHAPGRLEQSLSEHMAVFAALKARDAEGAEAAMRTHLTRQRVALRESGAQPEVKARMNTPEWIHRSVSLTDAAQGAEPDQGQGSSFHPRAPAATLRRRKKPCRPACCAARWRSCVPSWTRG
jgi:hypothetical protein